MFDQVSKLIILRFAPKVSHLNPDGAFSLSMGEISHLYISILSLLIFIILIWLFDKSITKKLGFILIISGGISNLIDRISYSGVVDFISLKNFPTFNLADSFITIGAILILIEVFFLEKNKS